LRVAAFSIAGGGKKHNEKKNTPQENLAEHLCNPNTIDAAFWRPRRVARQFGAKRRIAIGGIHFRR